MGRRKLPTGSSPASRHAPMRQIGHRDDDFIRSRRDAARHERGRSAMGFPSLGTRSDTDQGAIGRIRIPVHELYAQPKANAEAFGRRAFER